MSMLLKTAGAFLACLLLMGNKIVIVVPEGGAVVSSSGLVACSAREHCTIDTSEYEFAETFTAVPEPGYEFIGWGEGVGAVCGGSPDPDCAELNGDAYFDFPDTGDRMDPPIKRTLQPKFSSRESSDSAPAQRIRVSSFHRTRNYQVQGDTEREIWSQLHGASNPLDMNKVTGAKPAGYTSFGYTYSYQAGYEPNSSNCRVESGSFEFSFETILPQLAITEETNELLKTRWQNFHREILEHEVGHVERYRQLVKTLPEAMTELRSVPCAELSNSVKLAIEHVVDRAKKSNREYDEKRGSNLFIASLPGFSPRPAASMNQ